jgi:hypothetical protein
LSVRALEHASLAYVAPAALADVAVVDFLPFGAFHARIAQHAGAVFAFDQLRGLVVASSAGFDSHQYHSHLELFRIIPTMIGKAI